MGTVRRMIRTHRHADLVYSPPDMLSLPIRFANTVQTRIAKGRVNIQLNSDAFRMQGSISPVQCLRVISWLVGMPPFNEYHLVLETWQTLRQHNQDRGEFVLPAGWHKLITARSNVCCHAFDKSERRGC